MEVVNTVGRRKAAVARVYVKPGNGTITINKKPLEVYFPLDIFQFVVKQPLLVLNQMESYDININLDGGGIHGQARRMVVFVPLGDVLDHGNHKYTDDHQKHQGKHEFKHPESESKAHSSASCVW
mgnify:CR=1 FL=1